MLEPVREFALQCLAADGRLAQAQARHVEWFHAFVEHHAPRLCSRGRAAALVALRSERANLAAALRQLVREQPDAAAALRTTASLAWAWYFGGSLLEGRQWLREALALPGAPAHAVDLVRAHVVAARLSMYLFDVDDALAQAAAALQGARALGEARLQAEALFVQAIPMMARGPLQAAEVLHQSRELFAAASPSWATTGA